jgi:hypothetical protein
MTIPEHLFIGFVLANGVTAALALARMRRERVERKRAEAIAAPGAANQRPRPGVKGFPSWPKVVLVCLIASLLPDVDSFFGHYTSTDPWIGHRGVTHSLVGVLALGLALVLAVQLLSILPRALPGYFLFLYHRFRAKAMGAPSVFRFPAYVVQPLHPRMLLSLWAAAFLAGVGHLMVDIPQPASVWGGLPLYFPLKTDAGAFHRVGGWANIGWFNLVTAWGMLAALAGSTALLLLAAFADLAARFRVARALRASLLVLTCLGVAGSFTWMGHEIARSRFSDEASWYKLQMGTMAKGPPWMKRASEETFRVAKSLTRQVQALGPGYR